jgi:hypothetical protein
MHKPTKEMFERHLGLAEEVVRGSGGVLGGMVRRELRGGRRSCFRRLGRWWRSMGCRLGRLRRITLRVPTNRLLAASAKNRLLL